MKINFAKWYYSLIKNKNFIYLFKRIPIHLSSFHHYIIKREASKKYCLFRQKKKFKHQVLFSKIKLKIDAVFT